MTDSEDQIKNQGRTQWPVIPPVVADQFAFDDPTDDEVRAALIKASDDPAYSDLVLKLAGVPSAYWLGPHDGLVDQLFEFFKRAPRWCNYKRRDELRQHTDATQRHWGLPQFKEGEFNQAWSTAYDMAQEHKRERDEIAEAAEVAAQAQVERDERRRRGGRMVTVDSQMASLVALALGKTLRTGWEIWKNGTTDPAHREKLARAFAPYPERSFPGAWTKKTGSAGPGAPGKYTFRAYVESNADQFEEVGATLANVRAARGVLARKIKTVDDLSAALASAGVAVDPVDITSLWASYLVWRADQS